MSPHLAPLLWVVILLSVIMGICISMMVVSVIGSPVSLSYSTLSAKTQSTVTF